jgi:predicted DNA-binding WGR domain protein
MAEIPEMTEMPDGEQIFHCTTDEAHKFWRVRLKDNVQTVCYGRIGTAGHAQDKVFETPEEARAATARTIAQKLAKGYCRVSETEAADVRPKRPVKRSEEQLLLAFEEMPAQTALPAKERAPAEPEPASLTLF